MKQGRKFSKITHQSRATFVLLAVVGGTLILGDLPNTCAAGLATLQPGEALARLKMRAEIELSTPAAPVNWDTPLPPGLNGNDFAPPTPTEQADAALTLRAVIEKNAADYRLAHPTAFNQTGNPLGPDDIAFAQMEILFVAAREEFLADDFFASIQTAEQALRYDRQAVPILRLLAHNYLNTTGRAQALLYYKQILRARPLDEESLLQLARASLERGQDLETIEYFGRLLYGTNTETPPGTTDKQSNPENDKEFEIEAGPGNLLEQHKTTPWRQLVDPGLRPVAAAALGEVLHDLGYLQAAIEAWQIAVSGNGQLPPSRRFDREVRAVQLRQGALQRALGDLYLRTGQVTQASAAYTKARTLPLTNPLSLVPRMIYTKLVQKQPHAAMLVAFDALTEQAEIASGAKRNSPENLREILRYLRQFEGSALLAEALAEAAVKQPDSLGLILAAAAILPDARGINLIEQYLTNHPAAPELLDELLVWAVETGGPTRALQLILSRTAPLQQNPLESAENYLRVTGLTTTAANAWNSLPEQNKKSISGQLLHAAILSELGQDQKALAAFARLRQQANGDPVVELATVQALLNSGQTTAARQLLFALKSDENFLNRLFADAPLTFQAVGLFSRIEAVDFGLDLLDKLENQLHKPPANEAADVLRTSQLKTLALRRAELFLQADQPREAERELRALLEHVPTPAEAYLLLFTLYSTDPALADPAAGREILRRLLRTLPNSTVTQTLRGEQEFAAGRYNRSLQTFLALFAEGERQPRIIQYLSRAWIRNEKIPEGIRWFEHELKTRPGDRPLRRGLVDLFMASNQEEKAETYLRAQLRANPQDLEASLRLAQILRATGRENAADNIHREGLLRRLPSVDRSILLSNLALNAGDLPTARRLFNTAAENARGDLPFHLERLLVLGQKYRKLKAAAPADTKPSTTTTDNHTTTEALRMDQLLVDLISVAQRETTAAETLPAPSTISLFAYQVWCESAARLGLPTEALRPAVVGVTRDYPALASTVILLTVSEYRQTRPDTTAAELAELWLQTSTKKSWTRRDADLAWLLVAEAARHNDRKLALRTIDRIDAAGPRPRNNVMDHNANRLSDLLYFAAGMFLNAQAMDSYEALLRAALQADPTHSGVNNDLGYLWADRGTRLAEAETLITKAYLTDPANESYIDSLGWLRYKQGRMQDEAAEPNADEITLGAVSLLKQAAAIIGGRENPVILDHLGDALWRNGNAPEAVAAWERAVEAYHQLLNNTRSSRPQQLELLETTYGPVIKITRKKLQTVESGGEPATAPLGEHLENNNTDL